MHEVMATKPVHAVGPPVPLARVLTEHCGLSSVDEAADLAALIVPEPIGANKIKISQAYNICSKFKM